MTLTHAHNWDTVPLTSCCSCEVRYFLVEIITEEHEERLPRSPASIKGKNETYKKIKSSARTENGMQTSWSKIKFSITKPGFPVQITVLTDTGVFFFVVLFCFPILC